MALRRRTGGAAVARGVRGRRSLRAWARAPAAATDRLRNGLRPGAWLALASLSLTLVLSCGWTSAAMASSPATKVVRYRGYRIVVPASWPVYDLRSHASTCVRFNRHAVYLGRPSSAQRCPAHAVGRTEAILLEPLAARGAGTRASGSPIPAVSNAAQPLQGSSGRLVEGNAGVVVTATWEGHPGIIERALGTRSLPAARDEAAGAHAASAVQRPHARARAASAPGGFFTGVGFDACSTPSATRMSAWEESPYRAVGIYIGGANMACSQPNLTAGWVSAESAAGWHFIPTYVGLQAPSNSCGCAAINSGRATAEGAAAANDAVNRALAVGIGPGNPIYFDMEAYGRGGSNTSAVLAFLAAWTSSLHNAGYLSGVYGNGDSGISDLVAARGTGFSEPDDIWIAEWNDQHNTASSYVPSGDWGNHQRLHQYAGGHNATYGGVTMNIDSNFLDGATAGASSASATAAIPDGTFVQVEGSEAIHEMAGGAPLFVSPQYWSTLGPQTVTKISRQEFARLNPLPTDGTLLEDSTGSLYRVAGGAPLFVSEPGVFAGVQPVTIDHWNIANIANPQAHLNPVPAKGTFLTTTTGQIFRVAGGAPFALARWSLFGGVRPSVTIDQWDLANISSPAAHLNAQPFDGTVVEAMPSRTYWVFAGGRRRLTSARAAAVQVDEAGLAAYAGIPCTVPRLTQLTLRQVRGVLRGADCRLGRVQRRRHSSALRVVKQAPRPRTTRAASWAVEITLG